MLNQIKYELYILVFIDVFVLLKSYVCDALLSRAEVGFPCLPPVTALRR